VFAYVDFVCVNVYGYLSVYGYMLMYTGM
jgi:hypothetical protein